MPNPNYICRIAFDSVPYASTPTWTDVSADLMAFSVNRGRNYELNRVEAGTATVQLKNISGEYWPNNTSSALYPNVLPLKRINIRGSYTQMGEYLNTGDNDYFSVYADVHYAGQSFTPSTNQTLTSVKVKVSRLGSATTFYLDLYAADGSGYPTGSSLASTSYDCTALTSTPTWVEAVFPTPYDMTASTKYVLVMTANGGSTINCIQWSVNNASSYTGGNGLTSSNAGSTWYIWPDSDTMFEIYYTNNYDLYTGYIDSWDPGFIMAPMQAAIMNIRCSDLFEHLNRLSVSGYSEELSGTRINNVLDDLGWPSTERTIATGQSTIQAGPTTDTFALAHIQTVQDSELGIFYIAGDGKAVWQDRLTRASSPYDTPQAYFGDTATSDRYVTPSISLDKFFIYNDIRETRVGGTQQVATDSTSETAYGNRGWNKTNLLQTTDEDVQDQCYYLLSRYKDPANRVKSLFIIPTADPANLYPKVFGYDISTRINFKLTQANIDADYHIEGVSHTWNAKEPQGFRTTWKLSNATVLKYPERETLTLHPNGAGDETNISNQEPASGAHWDKVADSDDATYVYQVPMAYARDFYNVEDVVGTFLSLTLTVYAKLRDFQLSGEYANILLKIGSTVYTSPGFVVYYGDWDWHNYTWTMNLTQDELNAAQIGIYIRGGDGISISVACSQMYLEVLGYKNW